MKQLIIVLTVLLLLTGCDFKTAKDYWREANKLSAQERYGEAIELLDKAIDKDKNYLDAYINRGADKSALRDFRGAIEDYMYALKINPQATVALYNIGNNYKRLDDFEAAVEYYNKAFETKGGEMFYMDYVPNALVDLSKLDVPGHELHYERGIALYNMDSLQSAFNDFNAAIAKNYRVAECYFWLGHIYIATGQMDVACAYFKKSKRLGDSDAAQELTKYCGE